MLKKMKIYAHNHYVDIFITLPLFPVLCVDMHAYKDSLALSHILRCEYLD